MFTDFELQLFDVAYETLRSETPLFDNLGCEKEIYELGTGIEGFIKVKLIDAWLNENLSVSTRGIQAKNVTNENKRRSIRHGRDI